MCDSNHSHVFNRDSIVFTHNSFESGQLSDYRQHVIHDMSWITLRHAHIVGLIRPSSTTFQSHHRIDSTSPILDPGSCIKCQNPGSCWWAEISSVSPLFERGISDKCHRSQRGEYGETPQTFESGQLSGKMIILQISDIIMCECNHSHL